MVKWLKMTKCKLCERELRLTTFINDDWRVKVCAECNKWLIKKMRSNKHWKLT